MKFTTEVITQVLEQLQNQARQQGTVLEDLPAGEQIPYLYQGLQALSVALTKRLWEAKDQALHRGGVVCHQEACVQDGRPMRRTARRTAKVATVFGEVRFRREDDPAGWAWVEVVEAALWDGEVEGEGSGLRSSGPKGRDRGRGGGQSRPVLRAP